MEYDICPQCGNEMNSYECDNCGFADIVDGKQYETRGGQIAYCSEEEAFDRGYIHICPACCFSVITWWEMDDHGMCIECWHKQHEARLTKPEINDII